MHGHIKRHGYRHAHAHVRRLCIGERSNEGINVHAAMCTGMFIDMCIEFCMEMWIERGMNVCR